MPEQAFQILQYYRFRWLIERFHFVLKSGLGIESTQLTRLNSIYNWLAVCSSVAWRLLEITYHTRIQPERSAENFFVAEEWQALTVSITKNPKIPDKPPSLALDWRVRRLFGTQK
jgi:IS4 transposase